MSEKAKAEVIGDLTPPSSMAGSIKRKALNASPFFLALAVTWAHVFLSPYTKVEESFTLHAVHDFLAYVHKPSLLSKVCHHSYQLVRHPGLYSDKV